MSIKKKLLLTNFIVLAVMVVLAWTYSFFANALLNKFPITGPNETEFNAVVNCLNNASLSDDQKADALDAIGYKLSIYDTNNELVKEYGYSLKGYELNINTTVPTLEAYSDKVVIGRLNGNRIYAAVKPITRDAPFQTAKNIALAVMIVACAIVVSLACYYQIYTIFPPLTVLQGGLKQIAAGNYDYQLRSDKRDEIGAVIGEFEMMRRKLADLNKQKSEFDRQRGEIIAGISHDLKTPLTTIQGYTKGLMDGVANTPAKTERYLKTIYETALTMNALVNQLNDFSKLDIDTIEYSFRERDLVELIQDFAAINIPIYATKGLKIETDFSDTPVEADIDKDQFLRVVRNILDNSVKYKDKPEGEAKIKVYSDGQNAVLEIGDNGPGVSPHEIEYIFESYYRGDPSRTNPTTGSGLGLSIVKTIITAHDGTVQAVNDNGLKIIIKIPQRRKRN
ncbi:MAG: HAMP domain-containing histidine kinase [Clostridia bacterium]|nr:HAMP domain-containing histidine kinase [Clostridia bacterium]